jgi:hypothetical protein
MEVSRARSDFTPRLAAAVVIRTVLFGMAPQVIRRLAAVHHPVAVELHLPGLGKRLATAELELGARANADGDRCCGYFPALRGVEGIDCDLPACRAFAASLPLIECDGTRYRFNFLRLSLRRQSTDPAYHLDSDAATALSGDVRTLGRRRIERLLLNLSSRSERTLHYLDVDSDTVELLACGSYVRAANPGGLDDYACSAKIPRRRGALVAGLRFAANVVLHSGVDDLSGHFIGAYGREEIDRDTADERYVPNAASTRSRRSLCPAG